MIAEVIDNVFQTFTLFINKICTTNIFKNFNITKFLSSEKEGYSLFVKSIQMDIAKTIF